MIKRIKLENGDILIINSEVIGHLSGWIDSLVKTSKNLPDFGILSALMLDTSKKIYWHGGYFAPKNHIPLSFGMGEEYFGQYPGIRQVDVFPMFCCLISKKLIKDLGIPDDIGTDIFVDADLCLTAMQAGFKLYTTDNVAVTYQVGPKNPQELAEFTYKFNKNYIDFNNKWGGIIESAYSLPCLYVAKVNGPSGFAGAAKNYIHGMHQNGINMFFEPVDCVKESVNPINDEVVNSIIPADGDMFMPQIVWGQAPYFIKNSGIYKIGHCEFECTESPELWTRYCNMMDEIWVPTQWDKEKFERAGVTVPIYIIHQGIDPNYFHPDYAPMQNEIKETFKFICNAAWYPRKNLRNLVAAFQSEFTDKENVCLIIKTIDLGLNKGIKKEIEELPQLEGSASVYIREEELPDTHLPSLYTACDCFVLPTHGEGWGLPIFEALACGLPVITTGFGAPFEVLRDEKGEILPAVHFIDYTLAEATDPYVYSEGKTWAEPNLIHLKKLMRDMVNNQATEKQKALQTSEIVRQRFSWFNVSKKIRERIEDIYKNKLSEK